MGRTDRGLPAESALIFLIMRTNNNQFQVTLRAVQKHGSSHPGAPSYGSILDTPRRPWLS